MTKINEILDWCKDNDSNAEDEYYKYFHRLSNLLLDIYQINEKHNNKYYTSMQFDALLKANDIIYAEILPENYKMSYANPSHCVERFGDGLGQLLSYIYVQARNCIEHAKKNRLHMLEKTIKLIYEVFLVIKDKKASYEQVSKLICDDKKKNIMLEMNQWMTDTYSKDSYYTGIIQNSDLKDLRYLFKYDYNITENEIKTARFLMKYGDEKIKEIANYIVEAYLQGFISDNKKRGARNTVNIIYNIGQELIVKALIDELSDRKMHALISTPAATDINRQYGYDHKFDSSIYMDAEYGRLRVESYKKCAERNKSMLDEYSGVILFENFGEKPFSPEGMPANLKLSEGQLALVNDIESNINAHREKCMPFSQRSFTIISFPTPEIGERYEEIFDDIMKINMLDNNEYAAIQKSMIDALDKAEYIRVKGKDGNRTDIKVYMPKINNPDKETNFYNCTADVNIPLGEVYTTPRLSGTEGVLHLENTYLEGYKYKELELIFKDGYVVDYNCANYPQKEKNKQYIEENLLFPHKSLPIGEFAIGTNTLAYSIAKKYDILNILPVLIIEKMGPHFAIGDTCYARVEDLPVYNQLDGKEITARENERSVLRKRDEKEAYTGCHTDITLPYEVLHSIAAFTKDGTEIDIIKDGKFVLKGTEKLNIYL